MYNFAHHWDYFQNFSILTPRFMNKQSSDNINSVLKMIDPRNMKTQDSPRSSCNHPNKRRMWPQFLKRRQQKSSFMLPVTMSCADILQRFQVSCSRHNVCDPIIWKGKKYYRKMKSAYEEFQAETLLLYFIEVIHWILFFTGVRK